MILTCPQCKTKFSVPDTALGEEGRKVRCTLCEHTWFQTPDGKPAPEAPEEEHISDEAPSKDVPSVDEDSFEGDLSGDDITEGADVSDFGADFRESDEDDLPQVLKSVAIDEENSEKENTLKKPLLLSQGHVLGAVAAAVIFVLALAILFVVKAPLIHAWPALNGFYGMFGADVPPKGRNVVFNNLSAEIADGHITLGGDLVNLSAQESIVLPMLAQQLGDHQAVIKQWVITPPVQKLSAGEIIPFESIYEAAPNAQNLKIGFTLDDLIAVPAQDQGHVEKGGAEHPEGSGDDHGADHNEKHPENTHGAEPKAHQDAGEHDTPKASQEHAPAPSDQHSSHGH